MVEQWLGGLPLAEFRSEHFQRRPLARQGTAINAMGVCDWSDLDVLLSARPEPDTLVVTRGVATADPAPRSLSALRALFAHARGIVVRDAERQLAPLAALGRAFARDIPGRQRVLIFATPRGTHGFGWHYDAEDVFIVQTAGQKTYYFRENTLVPCPQLGAQPDFTVFARETTPLMSCVLAPGDLLYLPRGYWHVAKPCSDSLSMSLGVYQE